MVTDHTDITRRLRTAADCRSTTRIDADLFNEAAGALHALLAELDEARELYMNAEERAARAETRIAELEDRTAELDKILGALKPRGVHDDDQFWAGLRAYDYDLFGWAIASGWESPGNGAFETDENRLAARQRREARVSRGESP
jgi:hypothetical protein